MTILICKCCGKKARWCGRGKNACGIDGCNHIHCDHCGMHYSLESKESVAASTKAQAMRTMEAAYNKVMK